MLDALDAPANYQLVLQDTYILTSKLEQQKRIKTDYTGTCNDISGTGILSLMRLSSLD